MACTCQTVPKTMQIHVHVTLSVASEHASCHCIASQPRLNSFNKCSFTNCKKLVFWEVRRVKPRWGGWSPNEEGEAQMRRVKPYWLKCLFKFYGDGKSYQGGSSIPTLPNEALLKATLMKKIRPNMSTTDSTLEDNNVFTYRTTAQGK